jgi:hypothetical protein
MMVQVVWIVVVRSFILSMLLVGIVVVKEQAASEVV